MLVLFLLNPELSYIIFQDCFPKFAVIQITVYVLSYNPKFEKSSTVYETLVKCEYHTHGKEK